MPSLNAITAFLDRELKPSQFKDISHNGLQVENSGKVRKVCVGVDASMDFFEAANAQGADLLICHHGISWGDSLARITAQNYPRVKYLLEHDMALYASHLPLDAHAELGNNACIAKALGVRTLHPFGNYHGVNIGCTGRLPRALAYAALKGELATLFGGSPYVSMDFGKETIRTVAIVSGGAADLAEEAAQKNVDLYITGEPMLQTYSIAKEYGLNVFFGGHYATETFGVRALAEAISNKFSIPAEFINLSVPY
ncbi:MAG TPA: Nif3-like dinuclear metal center hexameric protein [Verrucomicrobia bacterium]|nr:Nif3-like dinuclear metal center hexameric protein [Verrucomicrobiota bacterium]